MLLAGRSVSGKTQPGLKMPADSLLERFGPWQLDRQQAASARARRRTASSGPVEFNATIVSMSLAVPAHAVPPLRIEEQRIATAAVGFVAVYPEGRRDFTIAW